MKLDRVALLAVKSQLIDHPDGVLSSSNDAIHHCYWEGVTCGSKHNRVTALGLHFRGLSGTISPFIGNLTFLHSISLSNNSLYGPIPHKLGDLVRLQKLKLHNNKLSGEIPANLSRCINLRFLDPSVNNLEGKIPDEFSALSKLELFSVQQNSLTGHVFDIIKNVTSLQTIAIDSNKFTGTIPNNVGRMHNLLELDAGLNQLTGTLPSSIFNLTSLQIIDFTNNQLHGELPLHMGFTVPNLVWLGFALNIFSGSIPTMANFTSLESMIFDMNSFTGRVHHDFRKLAILNFFVYAMRQITPAQCLRSFDYRGNETDRVALLAVKSQLIDHPDGVLSSWNDSIHHCYWEGVTCGRKHNRVTALHLYSRGLSGTISPSIGNLTFLHNISLGNNSLYGSIPRKLGELVRLQKLTLYNNTLSQEVPANLSRCINLRVLNLAYNNLEGKLPDEFSALSKLEFFSVEHNSLTGHVFDIVKNLTSLQTIAIDSNKFTGTIPNDIGRMHNLLELDAGLNQITGTLPSSLFNLTSLQIIDFLDNQLHGELPLHMGFTVPNLVWLGFADNNFSGSIPTISNFTSLEVFFFDNNRFTGRVPHDFRQFHNLVNLGFSFNNLEGDINFVNSLVNCTKLESLELMTNEFTGTLPKYIANLSTTLTFLTIGDSFLSGTFPGCITNLVNLQRLYMGKNKLTASLPHDLGKLQKLEYLDLSFNRLTGQIPNSLGNLSHLSGLDLTGNKLEGSIPRRIRNCHNLLELYLSYNELNGTLDKELFTSFDSFVKLDFSNNYLEGPLPLEIRKHTSLVTLRLSNNKFSGVLPNGLSSCTELQYLYMAGNSFQGDIPSSYVCLASLQEIDFSHNNLSGPIPSFFSKIPSIHYLNLSDNNFEGRVPTTLVFANASAVFLVGNSRLCGGIPELHLPKCIEKVNIERKKKKMPRALKLILLTISAFVGGLSVLVTGIYLACIRKKKSPLSSDLEMRKSLMKVSYEMLRRSTSGFSSENLLGTGSFGSVFKGILNEEIVAVKVLNLQHEVASKSFLAECKTLRNVRHRNLVGIITVCSSIDFQRNAFKALVYELIPNGSLDKWLHGDVGNITLSQRVGVAIDVAHALNYLHHECETPIVHCDLKPSNILLDDDMVARVGDFGIARFLTQPRHLNQSSTIGIQGTIGYAAPEYGLGSEVSEAGDVYSYGILLLELMTGKSPTDDIFKDDYNLHMYAEAALPDQVLQIVDPKMEEESLTEEGNDRREITTGLQRRRVECIISMVSIGVSCSNHSPQDRMKISDAIIRLQAARDNLLALNSCKRSAIIYEDHKSLATGNKSCGLISYETV